MSVYDELLKTQTIPHAYENWAEYRRELTEYLTGVTDAGSTLAVFGAGSCNDLDLCMLREHFSQITLIDCQKESMFAALDTYQLSEDASLGLKEADFLGITPAEYREYADDVLRMIQVEGKDTDMPEVAEYAILRMKELYARAERRPLDFGEKTYDYAIAAGVHSQINNMFAWLWQVYLEAVGTWETTVFDYVKQKNEEVIPRFQEAFYRSVKKGAVLACERKRIGRDGGIQGACQALKDAIDRQDAGKCLIDESIALRWPFDTAQGITYQMSVLHIVPA